MVEDAGGVGDAAGGAVRRDHLAAQVATGADVVILDHRDAHAVPLVLGAAAPVRLDRRSGARHLRLPGRFEAQALHLGPFRDGRRSTRRQVQEHERCARAGVSDRCAKRSHLLSEGVSRRRIGRCTGLVELAAHDAQRFEIVDHRPLTDPGHLRMPGDDRRDLGARVGIQPHRDVQRRAGCGRDRAEQGIVALGLERGFGGQRRGLALEEQLLAADGPDLVAVHRRDRACPQVDVLAGPQRFATLGDDGAPLVHQLVVGRAAALRQRQVAGTGGCIRLRTPGRTSRQQECQHHGEPQAARSESTQPATARAHVYDDVVHQPVKSTVRSWRRHGSFG